MGEEEETASKWKAFYMQTRILGPIFIIGLILITGLIFFLSPIIVSTLNIISAPTNTLTLHYGLIQPSSRVTATGLDSMVTTIKSVVLFKLQVHS